jgi:hypothetical protein
MTWIGSYLAGGLGSNPEGNLSNDGLRRLARCRSRGDIFMPCLQMPKGGSIWPTVAPAAAFALALTLSGCGADRTRLGGDNPPGTWELGEPRGYDVPPASQATISDAATGNVFRVPGGGGRLTITPVLGGPQVDATQNAFEMSYTGSAAVQLLVPHDPDDYDFVLGYAPYDFVIQDGDEGSVSGWLPFPTTEGANDTLIVELQAAGDADAPAWTGITTFKRLKFAKGTAHAELMRLFEQNIRDALQSLIMIVPTARRQKAMDDIDGPLNAKLYVDINTGAWFPAMPKYVPFWDHVLFTPRCAIVLNDQSASSVAHETGHYLHHVLVGNNGYAVFATHPRPSGHAIGQTGAKHNLIEEPAYYSEYFLNGTINAASPENGTLVANAAGAFPSVKDFTDLEGFAVTLLAALSRTREEIYDFTNQRVRVPVVQGDLSERFQACYEIIAQGTNDIHTLRNRVEEFLDEHGQQEDELPAMYEPLGWSYHAKCRFVDKNDHPLAGVRARPVCTAGGDTYYLPLGNGLTGSDGRYTLDRIFPGNTKLRVYRGTDSTDVRIRIPWENPTHQQVDLEDLEIDTTNLLALLQARGGISISADGVMHHAPSGSDLYVVFGAQNIDDGWNDSVPLTWNSTNFTYHGVHVVSDGSYTATYSDSVGGTFSEDGRTILEIRFVNDQQSEDSGSTFHLRSEMTLTNVEVDGYPGDEWSSADFYFYLTPEEVPAHVAQAYYLNQWSGTPPTESSTFVRDSGTGLRILIKPFVQ